MDTDLITTLSRSNQPPKGSTLPKAMTMALEFQHMNFGAGLNARPQLIIQAS